MTTPHPGIDRTTILEREVLAAAMALVDDGTLSLGNLARLEMAVTELREGKLARRNRLRRQRYAANLTT